MKRKTRKNRNFICPICNEKKSFYYDEYIGLFKCSSCGISESDFYFKKMNNTFI